MADERYKAAFEAAVEEVDAILVKAFEKKKFANMLATQAGIEPPYPDGEMPVMGGTVAIKADQFANYGYPSEAARAFLEMKKTAVSLDVIYDALVAGGFTFSSTKNDAKGGLRIALGKDGLVHKLPNGTYGLKEWYPNAKRAPKKKADGSISVSEDEQSNGDDVPASTPSEGEIPSK